jgi:multisubunit Na+/H+ antiporter MnhC subunit
MSVGKHLGARGGRAQPIATTNRPRSLLSAVYSALACWPPGWCVRAKCSPVLRRSCLGISCYPHAAQDGLHAVYVLTAVVVGAAVLRLRPLAAAHRSRS